MKLKLSLFFFMIFSMDFFAEAITIRNLDEIKRALNVNPWYPLAQKRRIKVAILDKGFFGYKDRLGKDLPADTEYFAGPVETPPDLKVEHGLVMAQLVSSIMINPELILYNAYGYSNLNAAVEDLTRREVDLVLYSEVWEFGGNRDGRGFINALVNKALDRGITWINAAGNFETTSYVAKINTLSEDWVKLPDQNNALKIECKPAKETKCQLRIVLSWNDFKNDPNEGSEKDLDLALTDDLLNIIETSSQKQSKDPEEKRPGYTSYPRETIVTEVKAGSYFLRVKNRSKNFKRQDELMITVDGLGLNMPSYTRGQSILNPADNSRVITVGALDSERSSNDLRLGKPELLTMSSVKTDEGEFRGSSNSAAFVAGAIGLVKSRFPTRNTSTIIAGSKLPNWYDNERGLSTNWLGFTANRSEQCFNTFTEEDMPQHIIDVLNVGGLMVQTTTGLRLMTPFNPTLLDARTIPSQETDYILTSPEGFRSIPRISGQIPNGWVELFQTPQEVTLCDQPLQPHGHIFRLWSHP